MNFVEVGWVEAEKMALEYRSLMHLSGLMFQPYTTIHPPIFSKQKIDGSLTDLSDQCGHLPAGLRCGEVNPSDSYVRINRYRTVTGDLFRACTRDPQLPH